AKTDIPALLLADAARKAEALPSGHAQSVPKRRARALSGECDKLARSGTEMRVRGTPLLACPTVRERHGIRHCTIQLHPSEMVGGRDALAPAFETPSADKHCWASQQRHH